jgi:hypothetical protein
MAEPFFVHENTTAPGIQLAHTAYGEPVTATMRLNSTDEGVAPVVTQSIMRPYQVPKRRRSDNPDKLLCSFEGCKGFPMREQIYCVGHARSLGLIQNWNKEGKRRGPD